MTNGMGVGELLLPTPPGKLIKLDQITHPPVEMWDFLGEIKRVPNSYTHDVAIAFGQGPVIDIETKRSVADVSKSTSEEPLNEVNTWCRTVAVAVGYLNRKGEFREAILSGGQRYGEGYKSEAGHMHDIATKVWEDFPKEGNLHIDDQSTNSLENMENALNLVDSLEKTGTTDNPREFKNYALVCSDYHAGRIKLMGALYNLDKFDVYSAEEVIKLMIHDPSIKNEEVAKAADQLIPDRNKALDPRVTLLEWIDQRLNPLNLGLNRTEGDFHSYVGGGDNIADRGKGFSQFERMDEKFPGIKGGVEVVNSQGNPSINQEAIDPLGKKRINEDEYIRGIVSIPANWLGFVTRINNADRVMVILTNINKWNPEFLAKLGVNPNDPIDVIRTKLEPYRKGPKRLFMDLNLHIPWGADTLESQEGLLKIISKKNQTRT